MEYSKADTVLGQCSPEAVHKEIAPPEYSKADTVLRQCIKK
jgi:hypothetical protein